MKKLSNTFSECWWSAPRSDVAQRVRASIDHIETWEMTRRARLTLMASLYDSTRYSGMLNNQYFMTRGAQVALPAFGVQGSDTDDITYNVLKSVIDTQVAGITGNRPLPKFHTIAGDWSSHLRAEKLNRFVEGQFNALKAFDHSRQAFRDACIWGTGLLRIDLQGSKIDIRRILPSELIVPYTESLHNDTRQLHHRRHIHAEELAALWPKHADDIARIATSTVETDGAGMVDVIESWHLPSVDAHGERLDDGRHTICIDGICLLDEEFDGPFPIAVLHYDRPVLGFWGTGIVKSFQALQAHLNEMVVLVRDSIRLTARPIVKYKGSLPIQHIDDNRLGAIIKVSEDDDFQYVTTDAVPESALNQRDELVEMMMRLSGTSMLRAQAKKPAGVDSRVALREIVDIEDSRFTVQQQQYEDFIIDIGRNIVRCARQAYDKGIDIESRPVSKNFFDRIKWSEVDLDDDKYEMRVDPVSQLPRTPAGKQQRVQELLEAGLIPREYALELIDIPDYEAVVSIANAKRENVMATVDRILQGGPFEPADPFQDLAKLVEAAQAAYLKHMFDVKPEILENLRLLAQSAAELLRPPPQEAPVSPPGPPTGTGTATGTGTGE